VDLRGLVADTPSMQDAWRADDYQQILETELAAAIEREGDPGEDTQEIVQRVIGNILPHITDNLHAALAKRSARMLREHRRLRRGFLRRNFKRWRAGFDLLERLIVISQEIGSAINNALRPEAVEANDGMFEALIVNHARGVQVAREILTLMMSGFADGALGRWRTLHEIAVVAAFISESGQKTAERYILHDHVTSYRRAVNLMKHHERANLDPIAPEIMEAMKGAYEEVLKLDPRMKGDYGWAAEALNREKPTFADLELATGLDHWRPRYKWATINTHGAYRQIMGTLGMCESEEPVLLVGESNSGMTDPAHMTAISLSLVTMPLIMIEPNIDRLAIAMIMERLSDEIGDTFLRLDRETYARSRARRWWQFWQLRPRSTPIG
jgi:hypothetical protein